MLARLILCCFKSKDEEKSNIDDTNAHGDLLMSRPLSGRSENHLLPNGSLISGNLTKEASTPRQEFDESSFSSKTEFKPRLRYKPKNVPITFDTG